MAQIVAGVTTNYALDPSGLAQVLMESTGGQSKFYLSGLAQYDTAWGYYLPDRLGNLRQLVNNTGQVALAQSYDPFGNLLERTGSGQSIFGYTGAQTDPTGLVFLRARYYNPALGRFLTADSMIPDPLSSVGWNRYAYAYNNPIRYTDPSGHCIGILLGVDTIICAEVVVAGAAFMAAGVYVVTSPEFENALSEAINSSSLSMLPGYGMFGPGANSRITLPWEQQAQTLDPTQEFNQYFEARRRLPGPIPSQRIPKSMPNLSPSGPPLFDPNQKPPELDPKDDVKKLIKMLQDPNTPAWQKVLILNILFARGLASIAGLTKNLP